MIVPNVFLCKLYLKNEARAFKCKFVQIFWHIKREYALRKLLANFTSQHY